MTEWFDELDLDALESEFEKARARTQAPVKQRTRNASTRNATQPGVRTKGRQPAQAPDVTHTKTLKDILTHEYGDDVFIMEEIVTEESVNIFFAPPGSGKSFAVRQMAACVVDGTPLFGVLRTEAREVLFLALEDREKDIKRYFKKLGVVHMERLHIVCADSPDAKEWTGIHGLKMIDAWCEIHPKAVVFIDMFACIVQAVGKQWNIYDRYLALYAPLKEIAWKRHVTIVAVAHSNAKLNLMGGTGSSGRVDNIMSITKIGKQPELINATFEVTKARTAIPVTYDLQFNEQRKCFDSAPEPLPVITSELTNELQRIYTWMLQHKGKLGMRDLAERMDKNYNTLRNQIPLLVKAGYVVAEGTMYFAMPSRKLCKEVQ